MLESVGNSYLRESSESWSQRLNMTMELLQGLLLALEYQSPLVTTMGRSKTLQAISEIKTLQKTLRSVITKEVQS